MASEEQDKERVMVIRLSAGGRPLQGRLRELPNWRTYHATAPPEFEDPAPSWFPTPSRLPRVQLCQEATRSLASKPVHVLFYSWDTVLSS